MSLRGGFAAVAIRNSFHRTRAAGCRPYSAPKLQFRHSEFGIRHYPTAHGRQIAAPTAHRNYNFCIPAFGERPDRRRGRKQGGERVAAVGGGRRSKDRGHPPGTATGIRHSAFLPREHTRCPPTFSTDSITPSPRRLQSRREAVYPAAPGRPPACRSNSRTARFCRPCPKE